MAKHNQEWLDDHIPALDQQTPRFAAQSPALRPRLVGLLKDIENQYLLALADGQPAFDPTWMWDELGLSDHRDAPRVRHPLWLAHESLAWMLAHTQVAAEAHLFRLPFPSYVLVYTDRHT